MYMYNKQRLFFDVGCTKHSKIIIGILAHFHHIKERIRFGMDFSTALKISCKYLQNDFLEDL